MKNLFLAVLILIISSCSNTIYLVRHAEKETTASDTPLSTKGKSRATSLSELLANKNIQHIFSTNTLRTISTATPLKERLKNIPIQLYTSRLDSIDLFVAQLKKLKANALVVAHSNTVNILTNKLVGSTVIAQSLPDSVYNRIFVVKRKGNKFLFTEKNYENFK